MKWRQLILWAWALVVVAALCAAMLPSPLPEPCPCELGAPPCVGCARPGSWDWCRACADHEFATAHPEAP